MQKPAALVHKNFKGTKKADKRQNLFHIWIPVCRVALISRNATIWNLTCLSLICHLNTKLANWHPKSNTLCWEQLDSFHAGIWRLHGTKTVIFCNLCNIFAIKVLFHRSPPHFWQSNHPKDICSQNVNLICIFCHGNLHLYQITCIDLHFALQAFHQQLGRIRNQFHHKIGCKVAVL